MHLQRLYRPAAGLAAVLAVLAIVALSYQAALARVPHTRAAIERVLRAYTGLDLRFATVELHWGWGGPEAVFTQVEMGEPLRTSVRVRAQRLVIGFNSWGSFRRGQLEISRVALIAPDIDLTRLARAVRSGRADAAPAGSADPLALRQDVLDWLARAPHGRIDVEAGTIRLPAIAAGSGPVAISVSRASLRRSADSLSATANFYLPERLGRSLYLAGKLDGDLTRRESLAGNARVMGQRLAIGPWAELLVLGGKAPATGVADLQAAFRFSHGRAASADADLVIDDAAWSRSYPSARRYQWRRIRARANLDSTDSTTSVALRDLVFTRDRTAAAPASVALEWRADGARFRATAADLPAESLVALTALVPAAPALDPLLDIDATGTARDVQFEFDRSRPTGERWLLGGTLRGVSLRSRAGEFSTDGLDARVSGGERTLRIDVGGERVRLGWLRHAQFTDLRVAGRLNLVRASDGWNLSADRVRIASSAGNAWLSGELDGGAAPAFEFVADVDALDAAWLRAHLAVNSQPASRTTSDQIAASVRSGRIAGLHVAARGRLPARAEGLIVDSNGSLAFTDVALVATGQWPAATGLGGRLSWDQRGYRLALSAGAAAGLALADAHASWSDHGTAAPRVAVHASGRLEDALAWLRRSELQLPALRQLAQFDVRGAVLVDLTAGPAGPAARSRPAAVHWRLTTHVTRGEFGLAWIPGPTQMYGTWIVDDGELQPSQLRGEWLGGPVEVHASRASGRGAGLRLSGAGMADGSRLARLVGDPDAFTGRASWRATLKVAPRRDGDWKLALDSPLVGLESRWPAPLAKDAATELPLHVEIEPQAGRAQLVSLHAAAVRALVRLAGSSDGVVLERGSVNLDDAIPRLPSTRGLAIRGRVARFDLAALLALVAATGKGPTAALTDLNVEVGVLSFAGQRFPDVRVSAHPGEAREVAVLLSSPAFTARLDDPRAGAAGPGARLRIDRLRLQGRLDDAQLPRLGVALPATGLAVEVGDLEWDGMRLGQVAARLEPGDRALRVTQLQATRPMQDVSATGRCALETQDCRFRFDIASRDAGTSLRDFGFDAALGASEARLTADVSWPLSAGGGRWISRVAGRVRLDASDGRIAAASGSNPLPLLSFLPLYSQRASHLFPAAAGGAGVTFDALSGNFALADGSATTEDLRLVAADYELLARGRIGLNDRDYDQQLTVLRGSDRLPEPMRRIGAGQRLAAAWLVVRQALLAARGVNNSRVYRLSGRWDSPVIELDQGPR
jgi:uncharacterized protein YhdP